MSSAILYLAIVAIWAGVLVPRWLRPRHSDPEFEQQPQSGVALAPDEAAPYDMAGAGPREDLMVPAGAASGEAGRAGSTSGEASRAGSVNGEAGRAGSASGAPAAAELLTGQAAGGDVALERAGGEPGDLEDGPVPARRGRSPGSAGRAPGPSASVAGPSASVAGPRGRAPGESGPSLAQQRTSILQARRRMLATLAVLTAGATGLAVTHLAASWVIVPPAFMLAGFLVLLREAAHTDAERTRRPTRPAARPAHLGADLQTGGPRGAVPAAQAGQTPVAPPEPRLTAQIIDISRRVGDQLYDQYSDAAERAVGD